MKPYADEHLLRFLTQKHGSKPFQQSIADIAAESTIPARTVQRSLLRLVATDRLKKLEDARFDGTPAKYRVVP